MPAHIFRRSLAATLIPLFASITAIAQPVGGPPTQYYIGASVGPSATLIAQLSALGRFPTDRKHYYALGEVALGMVFYSRAQQQELGILVNKAPYIAVSAGGGYSYIGATVGLGARFEDRVRPIAGASSVSWMFTVAMHAFVTDNIGVRLEYLATRWPVVGVEIDF
ncbi:MAG: hypothetical protein H7X80_01370 [bacterium]|nr:hypothetical protein [Candidatus Kapabacteria bacterium]